MDGWGLGTDPFLRTVYTVNSVSYVLSLTLLLFILFTQKALPRTQCNNLNTMYTLLAIINIWKVQQIFQLCQNSVLMLSPKEVDKVLYIRIVYDNCVYAG